MNAAALAVVDDPAAVSIEMLDCFIDHPAYPATWAGCMESAGIHLRADRGRIEAGWLLDDDHLMRDQMVRVLADHMDEAGRRADVLAWLETRQ